MRIGKKYPQGSFNVNAFTRVYNRTILENEGTDIYDKLVSHFDGADHATAYTDPFAGAYTFVGTAKLEVDNKKFGVTSLWLDGNSDYVTLPDSASWYFGTGNFTIECWVRFNAIGADQTVYSQFIDGNNYHICYITAANKLSMYWSDTGVIRGYYTMTSAWSGLATGTWYHIAFVRNGTTGLIFIDGVCQVLTEQTAFGTNSIGNLAAGIWIGAFEQGGGQIFLNGWVDEFRISKGKARWTSNFTPPTNAYGVTSLTISGLNGDVAGKYRLNARVVSGCAAGNYNVLTFNGDTGANYGYQYIQGTVAVIDAGRGVLSNIQLFDYHGALGDVGQSKVLIYAKSGYVRSVVNQYIGRVATTTIYNMVTCGHSWNNTVDNITSIGITSQTIGGLGVGTVIELWKPFYST